jgi:hypothetical protein
MKSTGLAKAPNIVLSLALGLCMGIFFHYLLYRTALPTQPFIYAAF